MRALLLLLALPVLATFAPERLARYADLPRDPLLWAQPVPLREDEPRMRRLGRLLFIEGWWLRSNHPYFGGVSAMNLVGRNVLALSDGGVVFRFRLPTRAGRAPLHVSDLPDIATRRKSQRDSEAMAIHGERLWVAFERANTVLRYRLAEWTTDASARPPAMRRWPPNAGSEAIVRLKDGRFLVLSEGRRLPGGATEALLFQGDPAEEGTPALSLGYRAPDGFRITDAAALPDGRILFLNRRISWLTGIQAKLTIADASALRPGAVISGRELAHFEPPVATDNYEALSIVQENGRAILWIASDDNFMGIQRTLLMKFALVE